MNKYLLLLLFGFGFLKTNAQEIEQFSLEKAINYGFSNNNQFNNIKLDEEIQNLFTKENVSIGLPQISAKVDYNYAFKQPVSVIPAGSFGPSQNEPLEAIFSQPHVASVSFQANQLIFDSRYFYGLKATKGIKQIAALNTQLNKSNLEKDIALAYYSVVVANNSLVKLKENEATLQKLLFETSETYKEGLIDELTVNRLELNLSNLQTSINNTKVYSDNALTNFKYTIGFPIEDSLILTDDLDLLLKETNAELLKDGKAEDRVEMQMMQTQDELNMYNVKQTLSNYFPNIYAFASYGTQAQREKFNLFNQDKWFQNGMVGVVINIPIFDGLKAYYKAEQIKLDREKNQNNMLNFEQSYRLQNTINKNLLIEAQNQLVAQEKNKALAEKIFNKMNIMFTEGIGSSFELSQAQADLTTAHINYSQAVYNLIVARYNLKNSLKNN